MRRLVFATVAALVAALSSSAPDPQTTDDVFDGGTTDDTAATAFGAIRSRWETIWNSPAEPKIAESTTSTPAPARDDEKTVLQQRLIELTRDAVAQMTKTELEDAVAVAELNSKARRAQRELDRAAAILKEVADKHPETPAGLAANRAINVLFKRPMSGVLISDEPGPEPRPTVAFGDAVEFGPGPIQVEHVTPLFAPEARPRWGGISMPLGTPIQPLSNLPVPFQGPDELNLDSTSPSKPPVKVRPWDSIKRNSKLPLTGGAVIDNTSVAPSVPLDGFMQPEGQQGSGGLWKDSK